MSRQWEAWQINAVVKVLVGMKGDHKGENGEIQTYPEFDYQ